MGMILLIIRFSLGIWLLLLSKFNNENNNQDEN
jgi:hypothetical protein